MKFTSLFALLGAASAQVPANNTMPGPPRPYVESPCDKIQSKYYGLDYQIDNMN
jgi:hypothetical protein